MSTPDIKSQTPPTKAPVNVYEEKPKEAMKATAEKGKEPAKDLGNLVTPKPTPPVTPNLPK